MTKMKRRSEFFSELKEKVHSLSVLQVISNEMPVYTKTGRELSPADIDAILQRLADGEAVERQYLAHCPFHGGGLGSFVITAGCKNIWYCFVDDFGGDGIEFIKRFYGIPFKQAVLRLAKQNSLINEEEEHFYFGNIEINGPKKKPVMVKNNPNPKRAVEQRADPFIMSLVYGYMPLVFGLSKNDRKYLTEKRHLLEEDLKDFFSYPANPKKAGADLEEAILYQYSMLKYRKPPAQLSGEEYRDFRQNAESFHQKMKHVPGFFENPEGNIELAEIKGGRICFLVKDDLKTILGVSVRTSNEDRRYVWLTSAWALEETAFSGGSSPGAPGGVLFPKNAGDNTPIVITEGRFKAEAIKRKGCIAIYVSGVGLWESVTGIIERIRGSRKNIFVVYDSDMMGNPAVYNSLSSLCCYLIEHNLTPELLLWRIRYGKGFDDLVENTGESYKRHIRRMEYTAFAPIYENARKNVLQLMKLPADTKKIPLGQKHMFRQLMQNGIECLIWQT